MKWIAGWNNRIKFEIDGSKINGDLSNFPVLVNLGTTYSGVFNELGNNYKKLSFMSLSTGEEYYCEVERWDSVNKSAQLWVKIPTLTSGINKTFYMLFDGTTPDNTTYIGGITSTPAKNVWDDDFAAVYHMSQDPSQSGACILDSTSNANHGTPHGSMTSSDLVNANVGKGIDFDGSDDYIDINKPSNFNVNSFTIEANTTLLSGSNDDGIVSNYYGGNSYQHFGLRKTGSNKAYVFYDDGTAWDSITGTSNVTDEHYIVGILDSNNSGKIFVDNIIENTDNSVPTTINPSGKTFIGKDGEGLNYFIKGIISEIRISNTARSDSWIKATYYSNFDDLLIKHSIETVTSGTLNYTNKIKLTIPHYSKNEDMYNFPVLLNICDSAGKNNIDITNIFEELCSVTNRKKIAITNSNGVSQLYVEIERWSQVDMSAQLWVKIPFISRTSDTHLYLYYDKNSEDNYLMVGDTNSLPAQRVWDDNFITVYHFSRIPIDDKPTIIDSTKNEYHGTPHGGMSKDSLVNGLNNGMAIEFDGSDNYFLASQKINNTMCSDKFTFECFAYTYLAEDSGGRLFHSDDKASDLSGNTDRIMVSKAQFNLSDDTTCTLSPDVLTQYSWDQAVFRRLSSTSADVYKNGEYSQAPSTVKAATISSLEPIFMAIRNPSVTQNHHCKIQELRISDISRSPSWVQTSYMSQIDNLLIYDESQHGWLQTYVSGTLSPWKNRIKIEIDNTKVDEVLENFPVLINLTDSSGYNNADLSNFFTELEYGSVDDDFTGTNGDAPNSDLWITKHDSNNSNEQVYINNGRLRLSATRGSSIGYLSVCSTFTLKGDFEIKAYYYNIVHDSSNKDGIELSVVDDYDNWTYIKFNVDIVITNTSYSSTASYVSKNLPNGIFKIKRVGSTIYTYYFESNSYHLLGTYAFNTNNVISRFGLYVVEGSPVGEVDNFTTTSGIIIWPNNTYPNRQKLAITDEDGETQLPVEIEYWDQYNKSVQLWAKVPIIKYSEKTTLYLYFDKNKPNNTTYVDNVGTSVGKSVWDSNFVAVYHMSKDPSGGTDCILDSTSNANHGTPHGSMTSSDLVDASVGKGVDFDGSDDYIDCGTFDAYSDNSAISLEGTYKWPSSIDNAGYIIAKGNDNSSNSYGISCNDTNNHNDTLMYGTSTVWCSVTDTVVNSNFDYIVGTIDNISITTYKNFSKTNNCTGNTYTTNTQPVRIGSTNRSSPYTYYFKGVIREVRISKIARGSSWIKATYYSNFDTLVTYLDIITYDEYSLTPTYYFEGEVTENGTYVSKTLYLYRRETGELIDTDISNATTGEYQLLTQYNEEHIIICIDNDGVYNPLIKDNVLPVI